MALVSDLGKKLKQEFFKLLKEDEEFRYSVAGLIGLDEILKRLDRNEKELIKLREDMMKSFEQQNAILAKHSEILEKHSENIVKLTEELVKLREDMLKGFAQHDSLLAKHSEILEKHSEDIVKLTSEIVKLRKDMLEGFEHHNAILMKHSEEIVKLREDMVRGFERHDAILAKHSEEIARLREDMLKGFDRHDAILMKHSEEIVKLREDMLEGFKAIQRHLDALGARWGTISEEAFREGLRGLLKEELGLKVEKWVHYDADGIVYKCPSMVDIDVAIRDGKVILIEITSHARPSDAATFKRKADFYEKVTGRKPDRLLLVTPYADDKTIEACAKLGIELYTKV